MTTNTPTLNDENLRAVLRLLGEVADIQGDQAVKRRYLMEQLSLMVEADIWMWSMVRMGSADYQPASISMLYGGMSQQEYDQVVRASTDPDHEPPELQVAYRALRTIGQFTRQRSQLVSDEQWYTDSHVIKYRQGFLDHPMYHFRWTGEYRDVLSAVGLHRRWGRPPFTAQQFKMFHIVVTEIDWLHNSAVPQNRGKGADHLTPRQRAVLALLLQGRSRKEIAAGLKLSIHTVSDHIEALYRHFKVDGRAALIKRFMVGDGGDLS